MPLVDPPGDIPSGGAAIEAFTSADGRFTAGLWRREPDTWSFERGHDEVALILSGEADVEADDGRVLPLREGDVLVTPKGSKGTWRIASTLTKFYAVYDEPAAAATETAVVHVRADAAREWIVSENSPGDESPPAEEWYAFRSPDRKFSTGLWRREPETGRFQREYHEIAALLEGEVDVESDDGDVVPVGPHDVLITPRGSSGIWRARSRITKFWAVHHE